MTTCTAMQATATQRMAEAVRAVTATRVVVAGPAGALPGASAAGHRAKEPVGHMA